MINNITSIILIILIAAYTSAQTVNGDTSSLQDKVLLPVNFMKQGHMGCSRTAFAMVMHHYDPSVTLAMVERDAPRAPDGGSENRFMALLAEQYGLKTHAFPGTIDGLISLLQAGKPVIVAQYPSLDNKKCNHDLVVVGYDKLEKLLYVHDPAKGGNIPFSYETFLALWESNIGLDDKYYSVLVFKGEEKSVETRNIIVDGMDADWEGMEPFSPDRADDTAAGDMQFNIKDVYCFKDDSFLYLKINFIGQPKANPHINYFFDFFYLHKGASKVKQLNIRLNSSPWIQLDAKNHESATGVEWKLGTVFEAKVSLQNFKGLPAIVSFRAGLYDTKRKMFIDVSYPNALKIN